MYFQRSVKWTEFAMYEFENNGRNAKALWAILNQKGVEYVIIGKFRLTLKFFFTFLFQNASLCKVYEYSGSFGKNSESKR